MRTLDQYYDPETTLADDVEALGSPLFSLAKHPVKIDDLASNIAIKYLASYLGIEARKIEDIRTRVQEALLQAKEAVLKGERGPKSTDSKALACLADTRATAAIFKEVAFGGKFMPQILPGGGKKRFVGVDLAAGSGILMPAMAVAALRKECEKIQLYGFNIISINNARRALKAALKGGFEINITADGVINNSAWNGLPDERIHYLTNEIVAPRSIPFEVAEDGAGPIARNEEEFSKMFHSMARDIHINPLPFNLTAIMQSRPGLRNDVLSGRIAMFPNVFEGDYMPDIDDSKIRLRTSSNPNDFFPLYKVGREFNDYEALTDSQRWPDPRTLPPYEFAKVKSTIEALNNLPEHVVRQMGFDPDELLKWN